MSKGFCLIIMSAAFLSASLYASEPVIYGADGRIEVYQAGPVIQKLARSTAARISIESLRISNPEKQLLTLDQVNLKALLEIQLKPSATPVSADKINPLRGKFYKEVGPDFMEFSDFLDANKDNKEEVLACSEERFLNQPTASTCSGFLIAPDLLVTAGHCMSDATDCAQYVWVFDYQMDEVKQTAGIDVPLNNVYLCRQVVRSDLIGPLFSDYAIIKLDRLAYDRRPLEVRRSGKIKDNADIFVIGAPYGLPTKVTLGANVRDNSWLNRFSANVDTYSGNSGSAVFDAKTGVVEGILVEGDTDFVVDVKRKCIQSNYCADNSCRGEKITRINSIPEIAYQKSFFRAAQLGDVEALQAIVDLGVWIDIYGNDKQSALLQAVSYEQTESVEFLVDHKADVNLRDIEGNTALHLLGKKLSHKNAKILISLMKARAQANAKNIYGDAAVHVAANALNFNGLKFMFIFEAFDKNITDAKGETVLFAFARMGDKKSYQELVKLGVKADIKNKSGKVAADYFEN